MLQVSGAIAQMTNLEQGVVELPCHILAGEIHHGIWVGERGLTEGRWLGVFRCQNRFWGVLLDSSDITAAARDSGGLVQQFLMQDLRGGYEVADLGPMSSGVHSLAAALATLDYRTTG